MNIQLTAPPSFVSTVDTYFCGVSVSGASWYEKSWVYNVTVGGVRFNIDLWTEFTGKEDTATVVSRGVGVWCSPHTDCCDQPYYSRETSTNGFCNVCGELKTVRGVELNEGVYTFSEAVFVEDRGAAVMDETHRDELTEFFGYDGYIYATELERAVTMLIQDKTAPWNSNAGLYAEWEQARSKKDIR